MRIIKLTLAYDGTDFHGWQAQPDKPTVQGALNDVLRRITRHEITTHGAGRTDAGVHATGQVTHFQTDSRLTAAEFQRALNALLPPAVRVRSAEEVAPGFHARHGVLAKTYVYRIYRGTVVPPFLWRYVLHHPYPLDEGAMQAAAPRFEGEHDFTAFSAAPDVEEEESDHGSAKPVSPVRTILESRVTVASAGLAVNGGAPDCELVYTVRGRSFLRYMVRKMVGTLLEIGRGRMGADDIEELFQSHDRSRSGPTVAPHGLRMESVEYATAEVAPARSVGNESCERGRERTRAN